MFETIEVGGAKTRLYAAGDAKPGSARCGPVSRLVGPQRRRRRVRGPAGRGRFCGVRARTCSVARSWGRRRKPSASPGPPTRPRSKGSPSRRSIGSPTAWAPTRRSPSWASRTGRPWPFRPRRTVTASRRRSCTTARTRVGSSAGPTAPSWATSPRRIQFGTDETVTEFEEGLTSAGRDVEIHRYKGTGHWFAEPSRDAYRAAAADLAFERTVAFLNRHLGERAG